MRTELPHLMVQVPPSSGVIEAVRMLGSVSKSFDVWRIAGKNSAGFRAVMLSKIYGERLPQSVAGINNLRRAFYETLGIEGECEAEREENFRFVCRELSEVKG